MILFTNNIPLKFKILVRFFYKLNNNFNIILFGWINFDFKLQPKTIRIYLMLKTSGWVTSGCDNVKLM